MKQIARLFAILFTATLVFALVGCEVTTEYDLTVTVSGNGSVSPSGGTYDADTTVTLTATPSSGWEFTRWAGDAGGTSRTTQVVMDSDKSVTAVFTESAVGDDDDDDDGGILPPVSSVYDFGPFETTVDRRTGPDRDGWVFRPTTLGQDGIKHPIYIWGPGAMSDPDDYDEELRQIASHGFVVYSAVSTGDGTEMVDAIDWLIEKNETPASWWSSNPYYQKLDTTRIAAGGHSRGSISTFAMSDDPRLSTTIHVAGGSFDGEGAYNLRNPTAYFCGGDDTMATPNAEVDYERTTVPVFFTIMDGVDHIYAAQESLPAMIAWLRWHLADETFRKDDFIGYNCEFCQGVWNSQSKNW